MKRLGLLLLGLMVVVAGWSLAVGSSDDSATVVSSDQEEGEQQMSLSPPASFPKLRKAPQSVSPVVQDDQSEPIGGRDVWDDVASNHAPIPATLPDKEFDVGALPELNGAPNPFMAAGLADEQIGEINEIAKSYRDSLAELDQLNQTGEIDAQEHERRVLELQRSLNAQLESLFSDEQNEAFTQAATQYADTMSELVETARARNAPAPSQ